MVRQKAGYQASIKEMKRLFPEKNNPVWFKFQRRILKELKEQIKNIESEMKQVIQEDDQLKRLYNWSLQSKG